MNNKIRLNQVASHFKYRVRTAKFERGRKMKIRKLAWLLVQKIFFFFFFPQQLSGDEFFTSQDVLAAKILCCICDITVKLVTCYSCTHFPNTGKWDVL